MAWHNLRKKLEDVLANGIKMQKELNKCVQAADPDNDGTTDDDDSTEDSSTEDSECEILKFVAKPKNPTTIMYRASKRSHKTIQIMKDLAKLYKNFGQSQDAILQIVADRLFTKVKSDTLSRGDPLKLRQLADDSYIFCASGLHGVTSFRSLDDAVLADGLQKIKNDLGLPLRSSRTQKFLDDVYDPKKEDSAEDDSVSEEDAAADDSSDGAADDSSDGAADDSSDGAAADAADGAAADAADQEENFLSFTNSKKRSKREVSFAPDNKRKKTTVEIYSDDEIPPHLRYD